MAKKLIKINEELSMIELTQGYFAKIDTINAEEISKYNWCAKVVKRSNGSIINVYAVRGVNGFSGNKHKTIYMHRSVLSPDKEMHTDHIDGDGLNNTIENLRPSQPKENSRNCRKPSSNTSGFKGVVRFKRDDVWHPRIKLNGKTIHLGSYKNIEDAKDAYREASKRFHREFGRIE